MKKLAKVIIFILIFGCIYSVVFSKLHIERNTINYFYDEPADSLDIMYLGSSNAYNHFNAVLAFHEYGFTTGLLSSDSQPFTAIKYLLEESRKAQNPKLYVIDISIANNIKSNEGGIRKVTDELKPSLNKIKATTNILKYSDIPKEDYINYYFTFILYHDLWKQYKKDLGELSILFKGHLLSSQTVTIEPQEQFEWNDEIGDLTKDQKEVIYDLIEYIKSNKLNVLFVVSPRTYFEEDLKELNAIINIIEKEKLSVLNFNKLEDLNINYETDYFNYAHLNAYGAKKFTLYFSDCLKKNFELPDHRNDDRYASWNETYDRYLQEFYNYTGKNYETILEQS